MFWAVSVSPVLGLGAGEPVAVADGGATVEALSEHVFGFVVLLGADVCLKQGVFEDFALGVAAADAGELRGDRLQVPHCVVVAVICERADAFDEGQGYFLSKGVSLSGEVAQAGLDAASVALRLRLRRMQGRRGRHGMQGPACSCCGVMPAR